MDWKRYNIIQLAEWQIRSKENERGKKRESGTSNTHWRLPCFEGGLVTGKPRTPSLNIASIFAYIVREIERVPVANERECGMLYRLLGASVYVLHLGVLVETIGESRSLAICVLRNMAEGRC